jgi:phosphatidylglycerophosphate synthase
VPVYIDWLVRADAASVPVETGLWRWRALGLLLVIGGSDLIDGFIARRYGVRSVTGSLLDAVADKGMQMAALGYFALFAGGAFPNVGAWFFWLVVICDATLLGGWLTMKAMQDRPNIEHKGHGKMASFSIFLLLCWVTAGGAAWVVTLASAGIAALILYSTGFYVRRGFLTHSLERATRS